MKEIDDVAGVAAYLGVPVATVRFWRSTGTGPRGFRAGKHLRWTRAAVDAWVAEQTAADDRGAA